MSQYNFFHGNWVDCSALFKEKTEYTEIEKLPINLDTKFFEQLEFDEASLRQYRMQATFLCSRELGDKPALCFSGGIDSQAMLHCFRELGVAHDVVILKFKENLNEHDIKYAYRYLSANNIPYKEIELDVMSFLSRENYDYGIKYKSPSPQFNVHYKFFNILKDMGYTGVVCGGNAPLQLVGNLWGTNFQRNSQNYMLYSEIEQFMCMGNFLSFYPHLAWATALSTPATTMEENDAQGYLERIKYQELRYKDRVQGYKNAKFNILRQDKKFNGFETIQQLLWDKTKDGLAFEKLYRYPLEKAVIKYPMGSPRFVFKDGVLDKISSIYRNNLRSN